MAIPDNKRFELDNHLALTAGHGGLQKAVLSDRRGNSAEVYLYGAHITSWKQTSNREMLFLSDKADFQRGKAIRGGIPLVFPQFGAGPLPAHGFARTSEWSIRKSSLTSEGEVLLVLGLQDSDETRKIWPHSFRCEFSILLGESLETTLTVSNSDHAPIQIASALHTYFRIQDLARVRVPGLKGSTYLDSLKNREPGKEHREIVSFSEPIDRVYQSTPSKLTIEDPAQGVAILIEKSGFQDSVLWNPGEERCKNIADLNPNDYLKYICVESANVLPLVNIEPGETLISKQILSVKALS